MEKYKVISLFAGCGGLDLGFKKVGFKTVVATDNWGIACETLVQNKISDEVIHTDIRNLSFKKYNGYIDVVIGGPPCPPYSQTRHYLTEKKKGLEDEGSGFAVPEYFRIIKEVNPKVFLFENVDGFMFKTHKEALNYLIEESEKLGFNITFGVINTANYGVPQTRKRFICVGVKKSYGKFNFPEETHNEKGTNKNSPWITCKEILSDLDYILPEEEKQRPGSKDFELLKLIPPGDNYLYFTEKRGHNKPIFKWKSRYWTFLLKLSPDRPSWTIQASFSNNQGPFHWKNRFLRIQEIKRIQTFDDNYIIKGEFKEQWRQIGNAVPPLIAEIFASEIKKQILK